VTFEPLRWEPFEPDAVVDGVSFRMKVSCGRFARSLAMEGIARVGARGLDEARHVALALGGDFLEVLYQGTSRSKPAVALVDASLHLDVSTAIGSFAGTQSRILSIEPVVARSEEVCLRRFAWMNIEADVLASAPFSKSEARLRGMKRYLSPVPCPKGHLGWRYVRNGGCCECASPSTSLPGDLAHLKVLVALSHQRSEMRDEPHALTVEYLASIWPKDNRCPVLGIPFRRALGSHGSRADSATLDRLDPSRGYVPGNVLVVSALANRIRNDASPKAIIQVGRFYQRLLGG